MGWGGVGVSVLYLNAAHGRWGAHLSQPTLRGRFLISSHCQPEHLRRLLPPVTWNAWDAEMKGWGAGKRERERVESEKGSDEQEEVWEVIWQALRHCNTVYSSLIFLLLHIPGKGPDTSWNIPRLIQRILPLMYFKSSLFSHPSWGPQTRLRSKAHTWLHKNEKKRRLSVLRCPRARRHARACTTQSERPLNEASFISEWNGGGCTSLTLMPLAALSHKRRPTARAERDTGCSEGGSN